MLIALFVRDELNYDKFWSNTENMYRLHTTFIPTGRPPMEFSYTMGPIIHSFKDYFPQVEEATRVARRKSTITVGDTYFEELIGLVDPAFFNIFDAEPINGDISSALSDLSSIVLTKSMADKYFPTGNAIGEIITINMDAYERDYKVSAIIKDLPENSQINLSSMVAIDEEAWKIQEWMFDSWFSANSFQYFTLTPGTSIEIINDQLPTFIDQRFPNSGSDEPTSSFVELKAQNIKDLHLKSPGGAEYREKGSFTTVLTFSAIAVLILLIASINFMNLSTARATQRAKEVSLRKVMGATRKKLIYQFIGESIITTILALLLSLVIVELLLPIYNQIIGKSLMISYSISDLMTVLFITFIVGILGGLYPAFILSSFRPAAVLKANKTSETNTSVKLRAALVILQFSVSITLFVSTAVVYGQMLYAKNINLGFNKNNMMVIGNFYRDAADQKLSLMINELKRLPNVTNVTWSNDAPGVPTENNTNFRTPDMPEKEAILIGNRGVGYDFTDTYEIEMVAGRYYDLNKNDINATTEDIRAGNGHTSSVIINETAVNRFGFGSAEEAIGKTLYTSIGEVEENLFREYQIIGVIPDLYLDSLKKEIRPEFFELRPNQAQYVTVRFSGDPILMINNARALWEKEIPSIPFDFDFATELLVEQYEKEQGEMTMFAAFSGLAILIACLGLYGLASFTAERRTKEIGIRKVMGAQVFDIVKLLVWQFSKPVIIANIIAWPVSFYAMSIWLESFVYRIENVFILGFCTLAGIAALIIAWVTIAGNSIRVARSNPIKALRYE